MFKNTYFAKEPILFKCLYICTFILFLYFLYETIFIDEEERSGLILYLPVLFGIYFIRRSYLDNNRKKRKNNPTQFDN
jgi:hypothetical protein